MPDHKSHVSKSDTSHEQLSESATSRTTDPNQPAPPRKDQPQDSEPGKHGRPTDDTDPGHN